MKRFAEPIAPEAMARLQGSATARALPDGPASGWGGAGPFPSWRELTSVLSLIVRRP